MSKPFKINVANLFNHERLNRIKEKIIEAQRIFHNKIYIFGRQVNTIISDILFEIDKRLEKVYELNNLMLPKINYNIKKENKIDLDYLMTICHDSSLTENEKIIKNCRHIYRNLTYEEQNIIIYSELGDQELTLLNIDIFGQKYMYNLYLKELNQQKYKLDYAIDNLQIKKINESLDIINEIINIYLEVQNSL